MNKVANRLLTFFIGVPLMLILVTQDYASHLIMNIVIVAASIISTHELVKMLSKKVKLFPEWIYISASLILTISAYILVYFGVYVELIQWIFVLIILTLFSIEAFTQKEFSKSVEKLGFSLLIVFNGAYLFTFVSRFALIENSQYYLGLFFILVFMCDSAAWFFGILLGKSTRGYVKASPNKSLVGFIGGVLSSVASGIILMFIFPKIFNFSIWWMILLGFATGLAGIAGDLIESVLKRACDVKDSGNIIPGRGGMLDCTDSILIAAPIFYIIVYFIY